MIDATNITEDRCYYAVPTFAQKFWRALGFRYHLGDEPPDSEQLRGWMKTDMHLHFGWTDRLRLLVSGRLFIASIVSTDTPSPMVCKSRMDWHIKRPGEPWD